MAVFVALKSVFEDIYIKQNVTTEKLFFHLSLVVITRCLYIPGLLTTHYPICALKFVESVN